MKGRTEDFDYDNGYNNFDVRQTFNLSAIYALPYSDRTLLNPAAFTAPKPGTFGNLERNSIHGLNFLQQDVILTKKFGITETTNIEFRTEIFNIFNVTNFANPPGTLPNVLGNGTNQLQPGQPYTAAAAGTFGILNRTVERTVGLGTNRQV